MFELINEDVLTRVWEYRYKDILNVVLMHVHLY